VVLRSLPTNRDCLEPWARVSVSPLRGVVPRHPSATEYDPEYYLQYNRWPRNINRRIVPWQPTTLATRDANTYLFLFGRLSTRICSALTRAKGSRPWPDWSSTPCGKPGQDAHAEGPLFMFSPPQTACTGRGIGTRRQRSSRAQSSSAFKAPNSVEVIMSGCLGRRREMSSSSRILPGRAVIT